MDTQKKKKQRCYYCHKKLSMINFTCKCNHVFCIIHKSPHTHKCPINYKTTKQNNIKKNNPVIQPKQISAI